MLNIVKNTTTSEHHSKLAALLAKSSPQISGNQSSGNMRMFKISSELVQSIWRRYSTRIYTITFSDTGEKQKIVAKTGEEILQLCDMAVVDEEAERISLLYIVGNNIYWREEGWSDDPSKDIQITSDGVPDVVFNGMGDWLYQEEVLGRAGAFYFNNNAFYLNNNNNAPKRDDKLAYVQINSSQVPEFQFPMYGDLDQIHNNKYPKYM